MLLALFSSGAWAQTRYSGSGTSSDPYLIQSVSDWNTFADAVTNGTSYNGNYFRLTTDITVSKTAGNPTNIWNQALSTSFRGTFDGDGHTITLDNIEYTAEFGGLFRMLGVSGTVKNLKVNGSVSSSANNVGGIVGVTSAYNGQCLIENCWSDVTITSTGTYNAGIVAYTNNTTYIKGCIFTGKLLGTTGIVGGGICGHTVNTASTSIQDCIFAPSQITMNIASSKTFCETDNLTTHCYYYTDATFGTTQGTRAYKVTLAANPAAGGTVDGGNPTTNYGFIKAYSNGLLCDGIYYANGDVSLRATANEGYTFSQWNDGNTENPRTVNVNSDASYTATFTQGGGGKITEDFETGDFSKLGWTFGGSAEWTIVNSEPNAGTYCAKSGTISSNQNTDLIFTGDFTDGTINFYKKVSSESGYDKLHFYIDDVDKGPWSGEIAWGQMSYAVTAGTHTLKWSYTKDGSVNNGSDCAWVDDIKLPLAPPTTIATKADWDLFCLVVNSGYDYSGKEVTMTADVSDAVTTMAGVHNSDSDYKAFKGTFNGQNHLLTVNISNGSNQAAAPFPVLIDGTIKNLKVTGTVTQTAGKPHAAGLVGFSFSGTNKIENCLVTVNVTNSYTSGDCHIGGIVGHARSSTLTMTGCVYNGTLNSRSNKGGLIGWSSAGVLDLDDCFCSMTNSGGGAFHPIGCRDDHQPSGNVDNCYYTYSSSTNPLADNNSNSVVSGTTGKGKYARTITGDGQNSLTVAHAYTDNTYSASGITIYKNGTTTTTGMLYNSNLYAGNGDQVPLTLNCTVPSGYEFNGYTASNNGSISGSNTPYTLTMPNNNTEISANITQMKTHIAASESATQMTWDQFAAKVNGGKDYSEVTIYLDQDITVTSMVGTSSNPFRGTFNGQGKKITLNLSATENICAPFRYINGATIQNLKVDGTVNGDDKKQLSGLVGIAAGGSSTIYNCLVSATLSTTYSGDSSHGGLVMQQSNGASLTIEGCAFMGTFNFSSSYKFAGFVGWRESDNPSLTFTNCVFAPASVAYANNDANRTFVRCGGNYTSNLTFSNCYYTSYIKTTDQGSQAYSVTPVSPVTVVMNGTASPSYNVSGLGFYTNSFTLTNTSTTTIYAKGDATLSLTLNGSSVSYDADYGTLTGSGSSWTLAMEAHNTQISASDCYRPTNLTVSGINANGATLTWEGGDAGYNVELGTASTTTGTGEILSQGFEYGLGSWTFTSMNAVNGIGGTGANPAGIISSTFHNGSNSFRFSSYSTGTDYNQYLVSPELTLIGTSTLTFYAKKYNSTEYLYVSYSTTTGDVNNFVWGDALDLSTEWQEFTVELPSNAKYIGFHYFGDYSYYVYLDDILVTGPTEVPTTTWSTFASNVTSPYTFNGETGTEYLVRVSSTCGQVSNEVSFTPQVLTYVFTNNGGNGDGQWNTLDNWQYSNPSITVTTLPTIYDNVQINAACTIPANCTAQANEITFLTEDQGSITIKNGGQLQHNNEGVVVTIERDIPAYLQVNEGTNLGYKIISFPVSGIDMECECIEGLLTNTNTNTNPYDFYTFDYNNLENVYLEWRHVSTNDGLDPYKGYLYASQNGTTISVTGVVAPSVTQNYDLDYVEGVAPFNGWQLVGNPFVCNAYLTAQGSHMDFYEIQEKNGYAEFFTIDDAVEIPPMGGVMVWLHADDNLVYSRTAPSKGPGILNMDVNKASMRGTTMLDRARVRFGEGRNLKKLQLNPRHTKLYIPEDGNDFSVYYAEGAGTIPVNFKAQDNGSYTLSFSTEDVGFNYLHLIDNMNGNDVDLLQTPYYTFDAKSTDFASRFTLVFATGSSTGSDTFAFFNNGVWIINNPSTGSGAEATLQVVDVLGHILSSETISGSCSKAINVAPGVYMLRLVNGNDVKVQKIVVR